MAGGFGLGRPSFRPIGNLGRHRRHLCLSGRHLRSGRKQRRNSGLHPNLDPGHVVEMNGGPDDGTRRDGLSAAPSGTGPGAPVSAVSDSPRQSRMVVGPSQHLGFQVGGRRVGNCVRPASPRRRMRPPGGSPTASSRLARRRSRAASSAGGAGR